MVKGLRGRQTGDPYEPFEMRQPQSNTLDGSDTCRYYTSVPLLNIAATVSYISNIPRNGIGHYSGQILAADRQLSEGHRDEEDGTS